MRFRLSIDVWFDADGLDGAQAATSRIDAAVLEAAGDTAARDPGTGALLTDELVPVDAEARRAFEDAGLGPGISGAVHRTRGPDAA